MKAGHQAPLAEDHGEEVAQPKTEENNKPSATRQARRKQADIGSEYDSDGSPTPGFSNMERENSNDYQDDSRVSQDENNSGDDGDVPPVKRRKSRGQAVSRNFNQIKAPAFKALANSKKTGR